LAVFGVALLLLAALFPAVAFGDTGSGGNTVDPSQLPDSSFIFDTEIADLSSASAYYDNQTVQVVGEVVGDRINADPTGQYCWILLETIDVTVNDSIDVYMSSADADKIDAYGRYNITGTTLRVQGVFHLVCPDHEGQSDIHATSVTVVSNGTQKAEPFEFTAFAPGIVAVVVGCVCLLVFYWVRERRR